MAEGFGFRSRSKGQENEIWGRGKDEAPQPRKNLNMKTSTISLLAATLVVASVGVYAADDNGAPQRAAANHFTLARSGGPKNTAIPNIVAGPNYIGGKHYAQMLELARQGSSATGLDLAHAPRPITASKDADLERKWRANAAVFQVAPVK